MGHADSTARRRRAVAVTLLVVTQRPTQKAMGSGAVRSQMDIRVCLRVRERRDVDLVLGRGMLAAGWHPPALEATRRAIAECERKLTRHRAALEAGADPALVAAWSQEVQQQRTIAEARLATLTSHHGANRRISQDDIHAMVDTLGGLLDALRHADPTAKAEVYRGLGVCLTYNHTERTVLAETRPTSSVCVVFVSEGGLAH